MGMRVTTNMAAINAQRNLVGSQRQIQNSMAQLSSGSRINKAADDAAGLAISEGLKSHIRSANQAQRNANDGISMVQTAEGGLNEIGNIIVRLRELGIQAASDTVAATERGFLDKEVEQLKSEVQRIASVTTWGSTKLFDGSSETFDYQIGIFNNAEEDRISFNADRKRGNPGCSWSHRVLITRQKREHKSASRGWMHAQTQINGVRSNLGALAKSIDFNS
jgi:flagellin